MNAFRRPQVEKPQTPPTIDEAQLRVDQLRRGRTLRGRAATMLTNGRNQQTGNTSTGN